MCNGINKRFGTRLVAPLCKHHTMLAIAVQP